MKPVAIIITLALSGLANFVEFRSIKESSLFFDWLDKIPIALLWTATFIFLLKAIKQFIKGDINFVYFSSSLICIIGLSVVYWHSNKISMLGNSYSVFIATTYQIGSDGGLILDFKSNGHLKAEKRDHWAVTYYWGRYSQNIDTVNLDICLDFKLGRQAILTDTSLSFTNDTIKFKIHKQLLNTTTTFRRIAERQKK